MTLQVETGLLYRDWVESRRAYVDKISGGKLGYVHIAAMGDPDLAQLYLDLDAQNQSKKGVVIDVRNNNGGYVNGRVIDVFARKNYLLMTPRDGSTEPGRQALGQRSLGLPTVLVTNESTLSDGEDFTEGYRTLGLGKVVGTPTAGWIIFTGAARLIDGSSVRVPGERIRGYAGAGYGDASAAGGCGGAAAAGRDGDGRGCAVEEGGGDAAWGVEVGTVATTQEAGPSRCSG